ncbi:hypothetical protein AJ79_09625 [Helicocarpus griseus UAMH5409]|uniref:Protein kinase domain-containing protein n=1 Tax=Helicocarpus griseus UAMH5409 TaxID=1447875 RepID=A0A2B7WIA3_9EURO|nr:hypothetical protein AJ79_09625 [Helicocarpus griseus UAMH5409]
MESASDLLQRELPQVLYIRGTSEASVSPERVSASLMHLWPNFAQQMMAACDSLDLSGQVSLTDSSEGELYAVANELGLTGRIQKNLCDPVAKALSVTDFSFIRFGDIQTVERSSGLSDIVTLRLRNISPTESETSLIAAGELKTFWTLKLGQFPVNSELFYRRNLEPHIGQLISYMRVNYLKYGFLSTYKSTVFVRRTGDYRFELSLPIDMEATRPSVRQCLTGFCILASTDTNYPERDDFDPRPLRQCAFPFGQASTRPLSMYRTQEGTPTVEASGIPSLNITPQTILYGDGGVSQSSVNCIRLISGVPQKKAVFEVEWKGVRAIAKCWSKELHESFTIESAVYERFYQRRPEGYDVFASVLEFGEITCSSLFPAGNILVITLVEGEKLSDVWEGLTIPEKNRVRDQCRKAVSILRTIPIYCSDAGKHNVLYSTASRRVTMIDLESTGVCTQEEIQGLDGPELLAIFGDVVMREPMIGG